MAEVSDCLACYLNVLSKPEGLPDEERLLLDDIVVPPLRLEKRDVLCSQGASFDALYAVRTGCLKQETAIDSAETLLTAFWLPGDLIGCDAIDSGRYAGTVSALETATLCQLPFDRLETFRHRLPRLCRRLQNCISRSLREERLNLHQLLGRTAEARVACFLLAISACFQRRGYSPRSFRLPMSRSDIGSYLGLTQETVGRTFMAYQAQRLLAVRGREYHLLDLARLERLASSPGRRQKRP
ncbi:helix-turn-helix domain-containing protein [Halomonas sp. MCCC 1A17488]|uniref:Helix-turn-helix domain-containing protein n=1 Tax=Billgrantia sulfidoxydans TaxID=2733484 RepID=A0ABX7W3G2_9GAMM|nr:MULTISPECIES: helix-turn-helix domain-containing protein [Halomonas]MCE8015378.1 helix-turn-helix domain-containing protein [Halomonas sp. MCCC 1A17488]MCG3238711.1 helix-turn-helix domain-containing protein [Halomonas sp. MCCC 1A17488]QPP51318.1 helix-turn-helix domain-containing protein [Halomonas sp. SS10-MC5]QTP54874.1 helix-turn-helix domain-containing protein [Halomonas sulfidoxydans]